LNLLNKNSKLNLYELLFFIYFLSCIQRKMGIGDWGLGIGDWGLGPIPNPQSPIPTFQTFIKFKFIIIIFLLQ
jgi:hypothetical protein